MGTSPTRQLRGPIRWLCIARIGVFLSVVLVGQALLGAAPAVAADDGQELPPLLRPRPAVMVPRAASAVFLDIALAGKRLVAVGERGIVILSDDGGQSWRQASVPVDQTLTAVTFTDAQTGWAVGHQAIILKTEDGGEHWALRHHAPEPLRYYLNVRFADARHGYVLGSDGEFIFTRDGGGSWQKEILRVADWYENHLFGWVPLSANEGLVAAEKGVAYRVRSDTLAWQPVDTPYNGSYFDAVPGIAGGALLFGMSGRAFWVGGDPLQWRSIETGTDEFLLDGVPLADGGALLVGRGGVIVRVAPDGQRATSLQREDRIGLTAVLARGNDVWLARRNGGIIKRTLATLGQ